MKHPNESKQREAGQMIGVLVALLLLLGVGLWLLYSYRNGMRAEGIAFGKEAVQRIAIQHDAAFLANSLSPQAKLDLPPMAQQEMMTRLNQLGAPVGPVDVKGDVTFQSQFFEPRGNFYADVNYPTGPMRIDLNTSHPVGRWQIDTIGVSMGAARP